MHKNQFGILMVFMQQVVMCQELNLQVLFTLDLSGLPRLKNARWMEPSWKKLVDQNPDREPPFAYLPDTDQVVAGTLKGRDFDKVANEGARTIPPRENGGNCDIKNLSRGSRVYFPVYIDDAKLSVGNLRFSQGDGEITFCGGIEMPGWVDLRVNVIKNGMDKYQIKKNPVFKLSPLLPNYSDYIVFEGISVNEFSGEQTFMLLGSAPVQGTVAGIVDVPNSCCTIALPRKIFTGDIMPKLYPED